MTALVEGETDATVMAELAKGRLRNKMDLLEKALTGVVRPHHRSMLAQHLSHIDFLDEQIERVNSEIGQRVEGMSHTGGSDDSGSSGDESRLAYNSLTWKESIDLLDTVPGVDKRAAEVDMAEIGIDMVQFPTAIHLTAWAGLARAAIRVVASDAGLKHEKAIAICAESWSRSPGQRRARRAIMPKPSTVA